jgi:hypothetical protein
MNVKKFTLSIVMTLFAVMSLQAQLLLHEDFEYPAGRPLILNPEPNVANYDELTGWTTYSNAFANIQTFTITEAPLSYPGYSEGVGNALRYNGIQGGGIFKPFTEYLGAEQTFYMAFMINFEASAASGSEFLLGVKLNPGAADFNWGSRFFAQEDFFSDDFIIGINKLANSPTTWATEGPYVTPGQTNLIVIKYEIGSVVGESLTEEAGKYDDVMSLFLNPELAENEPQQATLRHENPNQADMRRWGNTQIFGGAHSLYFRAPAEGEVPRYTIDGIKVGHTWQDVITPEDVTSVPAVAVSKLTHMVRNQLLYISGAVVNSPYRMFSVTGQLLLSGNLQGSDSVIDVSSLAKGVYVIQVNGKAPAAMKVFVP